MRTLIQSLLHFIGNWFFNSLALYACSRWMSGVEITPIGGVPIYITALELGLVLTLMNALLRPILLHLLLPLNGLTVGLFSLVINGFFIFLLSRFSQAFMVSSIWTGVGATFIFALLNMVLQMLIPIDDDIMYYSVMTQRTNDREKPRRTSKGIVILEIDGLSYSRLLNAVQTGRMPFLKEQMESGKFTLRPYDCGVPSQTSSCQAGIMFGRNENICAFRWYDKANKRVYSSSNPGDASDMEKMLFADGTPVGILNNGLSVNNIISGNAEENIFTISQLIPKNAAEQSRRNHDLYTLSLRPYLLTKAIILTILDAGREVISYGWDYLTRKKPRLNRLNGFYPLVRGATNILLRDISTAMIVDAVSRGREAMYTTFIGYDEIAHHSGPDSAEAYRSLTGIDRSIRKIFEAVQMTTARHYETVILSDHGQSFGATFKQRYGQSLGAYVKSMAVRHSLLGKALRVISVGDNEDNNANVMAVLNALNTGDRSELTKQAVGSLENALDNTEVQAAISSAENEANDILVLASGNLVNVYFQIKKERLTYGEIEEAYPGMIAEMVTHPGIGVVLVHRSGGAVVLGKEGERNLQTGEVRGSDPLEMYGEPEKRAKQLRYLLNFPNGGDLVIISPVYADGTVAAFEELIGSHGGMGGQQTEPFLMYSSAVKADFEIINAREVYAVLKRIRKAPMPKQPKEKKEKYAETTSPKALLAQICDTRHWLPVLIRTLYFSPSAYRTAAWDPAFNGPALLTAVVSFLCSWIALNHNFVFHFSPLVNFGLLVLIYGAEILAAYLSIRILRGKREPWKLTRAAFFTSYWGILWLFILTYQALPAWMLVIVILRINSLASSAIAAGKLGRKRIVPLFVILIVMIPVLLAGLLMIYNFVVFTSNNGSSIQNPF